MEQKIVIIGAGPTGLGAGYRLQELGYRNWFCVEQADYPGGLSASFRDEKGFWWDVGGHVLFSHYEYFDRAFDSVMGGDYLTHQRSSGIRIANTFVPYPFQNNIRYLPPELQYECLIGLIEATYRKDKKKPANFYEWCLLTFGEGITRHFMLPYNRKNWAVPLEIMSAEWIAERVSVVDLPRILRNILFQQDDVSWGPNATFKFPLYGATGEIYRRIAARFPDKIQYNRRVEQIDIPEKVLKFADGSEERYDVLISTVPLNELVRILRPANEKLIQTAQEGLTFTSAMIVGIGLKGSPPTGKRCWVYFPENNCPFYRVTYFHHYSPNNVPGENYYSFMCETSYSGYRPVNKSSIINDTIDGLINTGLITEKQRENIVSTYVIDVMYSYPVPTLERNKALSKIVPYLRQHQIYSRGRFGLWVYEVGNMDHSFVQGAEVVDHILLNKPENVISPFKNILGL